MTLRALNEVQYGGPLSITICHTTAYGIDTSPPLVYEVYGTTYDEETHIISTMYNARYVTAWDHMTLLFYFGSLHPCLWYLLG